MNLIERAFGLHEQALQLRAQRLELLSQNIANADTPNFKARDLDFKAVFAEINDSSRQMAATHRRHYPVGEATGTDPMRYRVPFNTAFDGNTVELGVEQAHYGKAASDYQATLAFLENRVSSIRKALRGE
jgi:flagellar basal-body rod protein FlgB